MERELRSTSLKTSPYAEFDLPPSQEVLDSPYASAYAVDLTYGNQKYAKNLLLRRFLLLRISFKEFPYFLVKSSEFITPPFTGYVRI